MLLPALDSAVRAELKQLRIIHGKGTGALRQRVAEVCADPAVDGVVVTPPPCAEASSGSTDWRPISSFHAPTMNSRIEMVPPCAKKGRTRRSASTPATPEEIERQQQALDGGRAQGHLGEHLRQQHQRLVESIHSQTDPHATRGRYRHSSRQHHQQGKDSFLRFHDEQCEPFVTWLLQLVLE